MRAATANGGAPKWRKRGGKMADTAGHWRPIAPASTRADHVPTDMSEQACQWPDGCNRGAFRRVLMPAHGERWLCLRHAGQVWNGRKSANRAAGLCPCGAEPTPGRRTCERCRERAREDRRRARNYARLAAECGIRLPRAPGRRRDFVAAYAEAFRLAQRQALKAVRRALARGLRWRGRVAVSTSWEGHPVTVQAATLPDGRLAVHGIPA